MGRRIRTEHDVNFCRRVSIDGAEHDVLETVVVEVACTAEEIGLLVESGDSYAVVGIEPGVAFSRAGGLQLQFVRQSVAAFAVNDERHAR